MVSSTGADFEVKYISLKIVNELACKERIGIFLYFLVVEAVFPLRAQVAVRRNGGPAATAVFDAVGATNLHGGPARHTAPSLPRKPGQSNAPTQFLHNQLSMIA